MADRVRQAATGIPRRIRRVQAHPGGLDEAVPSEIHRGHRPPPTGADADQTPGQGHGAVRDFPFPAAGGKMKSVLRAASYGTKCPIAEGMTGLPQLLDTLSSQRVK